jgi:hypothetical protein
MCWQALTARAVFGALCTPHPSLQFLGRRQGNRSGIAFAIVHGHVYVHGHVGSHIVSFIFQHFHSMFFYVPYDAANRQRVAEGCQFASILTRALPCFIKRVFKQRNLWELSAIAFSQTARQHRCTSWMA